jgi:hypothetical protein
VYLTVVDGQLTVEAILRNQGGPWTKDKMAALFEYVFKPTNRTMIALHGLAPSLRPLDQVERALCLQAR